MRAGQSLPSEPARATLNTFEPGLNDAEAPRSARWESTDKRQKPEYNELASATAATIAASPATNTLRLTALVTAEDVRVRQALGQPNGYSRTEEVLVETDSFKITRSSDGTVRNDLHNRPDLKAPVVQSPNRPSLGATLTQEQIDKL